MNDIFKIVTVEQFKDYYFRDFPYLPFYNNDKVYFKGDVVYNLDNFYESLVDDNTSPLNDSEKWKIVNLSKYNYITDEDIEKAKSQALLNANENFGADDNDKITIFLHLVAFYLAMDIQNASGSVNSSYRGLVASKSVGDVSESYNFPTWLLNTPLYSLYSQNGYGLKYLSLILPYISCTILFARGNSTVG